MLVSEAKVRIEGVIVDEDGEKREDVEEMGLQLSVIN